MRAYFETLHEQGIDRLSRNIHNTFSLFLRPALHKSIQAQGFIQSRINQSEILPKNPLFFLNSWPKTKNKRIERIQIGSKTH